MTKNLTLDNIRAEVEKYLDSYLTVRFPNTLWEAMRYSTLAGGKRIRPVLAVETCLALGGKLVDILPAACALEILHTYTLIHDDLPSMDNDDLRRGKPTCHKVYGEWAAILAGDAMFALALQLIVQNTPKTVKSENLLKVIEEFSIIAGPSGVVGGQVVDIESEGKEISDETFSYIHSHKTADLFKFAVRSGAIIADASVEKLNAITLYSEKIGYAFQIADDILDLISTSEEMGKTVGKDEKQDKKSHVKVWGLEKSISELDNLCNEAKIILDISGIISTGLNSIADEIYEKVRKIYDTKYGK